MSRKTVMWRKKFRQAGDKAEAVLFPGSSVAGRGRTKMKRPNSKTGEIMLLPGRASVIPGTQPMSAAKAARVQRRVKNAGAGKPA